MPADMNAFDRNARRQVAWQIELNQARTPTERFEALCDLLDTVRAMAPTDESALARRRRALLRREHDREQWRVQCRRLLAQQRALTPPSV